MNHAEVARVIRRLVSLPALEANAIAAFRHCKAVALRRQQVAGTSTENIFHMLGPELSWMLGVVTVVELTNERLQAVGTSKQLPS